MRRHQRTRLLAAGSFLILFFAIVPGMAYTGAWSGPEGEIDVIIAQQPAGSHHHDKAGADSDTSGIQQCRVGPSRCTGQPSFVSTTWLGDETWALVPPSQALEIFGAGHDIAFQPPVYRMKPPPREA